MERFTFMADCLEVSKSHDGVREQPIGSNRGVYVCKVLAMTTYRSCGAPWCAAHTTNCVQTVARRNGGPDFPCDSAAVETWDRVLDGMGFEWKGTPADLPLGAIICQGGRHITFFAGWMGRAPRAFVAGSRYKGHGGNQANMVTTSVYAWTGDTRAYVIPDSWDKRALPPKPRPLYEVLTNEDGVRKRVFHGRHVPTLINRVRRAVKGGATNVVIRRKKP